MRKYFKFSNFLVLLSLFFGVALGFTPSSEVMQKTATIFSEFFLKSLKLISLPLIFLSIVSSISSMNNFHRMKQVGGKILFYTLVTTVISACIGLFLFLGINPIQKIYTTYQAVSNAASSQGYLSFLANSFPENIITPFVEGNVLAIAFLGIVIGCSTLLLPNEPKKLLQSFFSAFFQLFLQITKGIIFLFPAGMWAFSYLFIQEWQNGLGGAHLLYYTLVVILANLIQGIIVLPALLKLKKISPGKTIKGSFSALTCAFFTKSSNAALPLTISSAEKNLGIRGETARFSLPLCSVINMNGCAAFIITTLLFVTGSYGVVFSWPLLIGFVLLSTLAAVGNAGVPMGCYFLTSAILMSMNFPLYIMGLILPIYTILDMIETSLNVWSDICVTSMAEADLLKKEFVQNDALVETEA